MINVVCRLDSNLVSKQYLESQLAVALGGRLAEELIYGENEVRNIRHSEIVHYVAVRTQVTTGASNDLQQVSRIARAMVCEYGMSNKVGLMHVVEESYMFSNEGGKYTQLCLSNTVMLTHSSLEEWSEDVLEAVDAEVLRLVSNAYVLGKKILTENIELLHAMAIRLMEQVEIAHECLQHITDTCNVQETINADELQLMLWEYDAQMAPFGVFPDNVDRSIYFPYSVRA
jgi:cell division protease FtsH